MVDLKNIHVRPLVHKDWSVMLPWFADRGTLNRHLFYEEMVHCTIYIAADENDTPISTLTCTRLKNCVYLSYFLTDPKFRGKGVGLQLWQTVVNREGPERNFALKSAPHMTEKYKTRSGFVLRSSADLESFTGKLTSDLVKVAVKKVENLGTINVTDQLTKSAVKDIIDYDTVLHGEDTFAFLTVWLKHCNCADKKVDLIFDPPMYTVYARNEVTGQIAGYGTVVKCVKTTRIGPLYADSYEVCLKILEKLIQHQLELDQNDDANELEYEFNVASVNTNLKTFLIESGFRFIQFHNCYTKEIVNVDCEKVFCFARHIGTF